MINLLEHRMMDGVKTYIVASDTSCHHCIKKHLDKYGVKITDHMEISDASFRNIYYVKDYTNSEVTK